ncbi:hypothetical protein VXN63_02350 [Marinilactibacillus sp. XAAS-LB27]|uniref:hypothetical protein n=1 Tax=Marinilactibacillus sp. XAAS-LB27 TaxID=3114538 RepID=UPI002E18F82F|nr:hypothetical protein [Marinilactibacillus sp. XAAS-LB27]
MKNKLVLLSLSSFFLIACNGEDKETISNYESTIDTLQNDNDKLNQENKKLVDENKELKMHNKEIESYVEEFLTDWESSIEESTDDPYINDIDGLETFSLGDTIRFDTGHEFKVTDIYVTDEAPNPSDIINRNFVRVDFSFKNGESEDVTLAGENILSLYDSNGEKAKMTSKNFLYAEVSPGELLETSIYFDAGQGPYQAVTGDIAWVSE